jgi:CHASE2 domain-containing sensor protein
VQRNVAVFLDIYRQLPAEALPLLENSQAALVAAGEPEDKLVNGWIAELRTRLGIKPPPKPEAAAEAATAQDTEAEKPQ